MCTIGHSSILLRSEKGWANAEKGWANAEDQTELTITVGEKGLILTEYFQPETGKHPVANPLRLAEGTYRYRVPVPLPRDAEVSLSLEGDEIVVKPTGR